MAEVHEYDIFISYASADRAGVERLVSELSALGVRVWVDYESVLDGEDIVGAVQRGIRKSRCVGVWLTRQGITSRWVQREWGAKFEDDLAAEDSVVVLPLLAEDCEVPELIRGKKYFDFRSDYDDAVSRLVSALGVAPRNSGGVVTSWVKDMVDALESVTIHLPYNRSIRVIDTLRKTPRSGKQVRLVDYEPQVPVRTVYDHLFSVAHTADCLLHHIDHGIASNQVRDVARCIAFHELNEVLIGDIPAFTNLSDRRAKNLGLPGWVFMDRVPKERRERVANQFIGLFLDRQEQESMERVEQLMSYSNPVGDFFTILDRIDPIIAVWRYLHVFRGHLDSPGATGFLKRMKDFFDYPEVDEAARAYRRDRKLHNLVTTLQDRHLAHRYYLSEHALIDPSLFSNRNESLPSVVVKRIIEGRQFSSTIRRARARGRGALPSGHGGG